MFPREKNVGKLNKMVPLKLRLPVFFFSRSTHLYRERFPVCPPNTYHNHDPISPWEDHHRNLESFFGVEQTILPYQAQTWKDSSDETIFTFLPGFCKSLTFFQAPTPRMLPNSNASKRFKKDDFHTLHWGYHSYPMNGIKYWKIFAETNIPLLLKLKTQIIELEQALRVYHYSDWQKKKALVPSGFGLFGTIWTTLAINYSSCQWHVDRTDIGLTALLYMGDFQQGEVKLAQPFNVEVPVKTNDLLFLQSSKVYHKSVPFTGNRVNLVFYTGRIRNEKLIPCSDLF